MLYQSTATIPDDPAGADLQSPPGPGRAVLGAGSRVAGDSAWAEAACGIARGDTMTAVAERLGCARSTLWRTLQRSERLRTRIAEERRALAVEAALRFKGLHGAALDAIETAVRRGDLRAAFWVADRLGLTRLDVDDARAGLDVAEDAAAWGEAPPVDPALFALGAPLELEPEVLAPEILEGEAREPNAREPAAPAEAARSPTPSAKPKAVPTAAARRATRRETRSTLLHRPADPAADRVVSDLLRTLPATDVAWPGVQRNIGAIR